MKSNLSGSPPGLEFIRLYSPVSADKLYRIECSGAQETKVKTFQSPKTDLHHCLAVIEIRLSFGTFIAPKTYGSSTTEIKIKKLISLNWKQNVMFRKRI